MTGIPSFIYMNFIIKTFNFNDKINIKILRKAGKSNYANGY